MTVTIAITYMCPRARIVKNPANKIKVHNVRTLKLITFFCRSSVATSETTGKDCCPISFRSQTRELYLSRIYWVWILGKRRWPSFLVIPGPAVHCLQSDYCSRWSTLQIQHRSCVLSLTCSLPCNKLCMGIVSLVWILTKS